MNLALPGSLEKGCETGAGDKPENMGVKGDICPILSDCDICSMFSRK